MLKHLLKQICIKPNSRGEKMTPAKGLPYTAFIFVSRVPLKGSFTYLISRSPSSWYSPPSCALACRWALGILTYHARLMDLHCRCRCQSVTDGQSAKTKNFSGPVAQRGGVCRGEG